MNALPGWASGTALSKLNVKHCCVGYCRFYYKNIVNVIRHLVDFVVLAFYFFVIFYGKDAVRYLVSVYNILLLKC